MREMKSKSELERNSRAVDWEERKGDFSDEGKRLVIPEQLTVTEEERTLYNSSKDQVKKRAIRLGVIGFAIAACYSISFSNGLLEVIKVVIAVAVCVVTFFLTKSKGGSTNVKQDYIDNCVKPLVHQCDPSIQVHSELDVFPTYGTCGYTGASSIERQFEREQAEDPNFDTSGAREVAEKYLALKGKADGFLGNFTSGRAYNRLGAFLYAHRVLPQFDEDFSVNLVMDGLSQNREGFFLVNAVAYNQSKTASNGQSKKIPRFTGTVVAVRMKHTPRCDVSLFTSDKHLGKEFTNGYLPVRDTIDTENDVFNDNFEVSASEESQAFFILSPLVMERLLALKGKYSRFGVYVHDDYLVVGMNWGKQPLSMPDKIAAVKTMSIEQSFADMRELLTDVYEIKDAIDLNFEH